MSPRARAALASGLLGLALAAPASADRPAAEQYQLHCAGCHGPNGRGIPGTTPSLHDLAPLAKTPEGRAYLARVPGVAQAPIDDAALAELLTWVLREFSQVEVSPRYTAREVGRLREDPLRDPIAARPSNQTTR